MAKIRFVLAATLAGAVAFVPAGLPVAVVTGMVSYSLAWFAIFVCESISR